MINAICKMCARYFRTSNPRDRLCFECFCEADYKAQKGKK